MSTRNVNKYLSDHVAIQDLISRYTNAVNQRDWDALAAVFAKNAIWDCGDVEGFTFLFTGLSNVVSGIAGVVEPCEVCVQTIHAVVVEIDGDRATATTTVHEMARVKGGMGMNLMIGTYYDDIVRDDDSEWRFAKRTFRLTYVDVTIPAGLVATSFPLVKRPG